jgi:DNA-binding protein H-NS
MSIEELTQLHSHLSRHLDERRQSRIKQLQAELKALGAAAGPANSTAGKPSFGKRAGGDAAKSAGGDAAKSAGGADGSGNERSKPKVTHRGPNGETWTSRGAKPRWLSALIAEGKNPDDYRV